MDQLLSDLYNPASGRFQQYLTAEAFAEEFGPTERDYDATIAFAKSGGMTLIATHPNRTLVTLSGQVADIEAMLGVRNWSGRGDRFGWSGLLVTLRMWWVSRFVVVWS